MPGIGPDSVTSTDIFFGYCNFIHMYEKIKFVAVVVTAHELQTSLYHFVLICPQPA